MPGDPARLRASFGKTIAAYGAMIAGAIALFLWIRARGLDLTAPPPADAAVFGTTAPGDTTHVLLHVLLALAVILAAARAVGVVFRRIGQPPVIGEVVAGILLGPSLLGRISPEAYAFILPASVAPSLGLLSQLGVVLYMFLVGVELDTSVLRSQIRSTAAIALTSIAVPFVLGLWLARALYPEFAPAGVSASHFALFVGVAMSITAFPVLARILTDRGISTTPLGRLSLTCAAIGDVTAWCLLAFVVGVVQSAEGRAWLPAALTVAFIAFMFVVARPIVVRLLNRAKERQLEQGALAI